MQQRAGAGEGGGGGTSGSKHPRIGSSMGSRWETRDVHHHGAAEIAAGRGWKGIARKGWRSAWGLAEAFVLIHSRSWGVCDWKAFERARSQGSMGEGVEAARSHLLSDAAPARQTRPPRPRVSTFAISRGRAGPAGSSSSRLVSGCNCHLNIAAGALYRRGALPQYR